MRHSSGGRVVEGALECASLPLLLPSLPSCTAAVAFPLCLLACHASRTAISNAISKVGDSHCHSGSQSLWKNAKSVRACICSVRTHSCVRSRRLRHHSLSCTACREHVGTQCTATLASSGTTLVALFAALTTAADGASAPRTVSCFTVAASVCSLGHRFGDALTVQLTFPGRHHHGLLIRSQPSRNHTCETSRAIHPARSARAHRLHANAVERGTAVAPLPSHARLPPGGRIGSRFVCHADGTAGRGESTSSVLAARCQSRPRAVQWRSRSCDCDVASGRRPCLLSWPACALQRLFCSVARGAGCAGAQIAAQQRQRGDARVRGAVCCCPPPPPIFRKCFVRIQCSTHMLDTLFFFLFFFFASAAPTKTTNKQIRPSLPPVFCPRDMQISITCRNGAEAEKRISSDQPGANAFSRHLPKRSRMESMRVSLPQTSDTL